MNRILAACCLLLALALPSMASASCQYYFLRGGVLGKLPTTGPITYLFDGQVPDAGVNAAKGTVIYSKTIKGGDAIGGNPVWNPYFECTQDLGYNQFIVISGPQTSIPYVYESGIPGIGIRVIFANYLQSPWTGDLLSGFSNATSEQISHIDSWRVELVKTIDGPLSAGGTINGPIAEMRIDQGGVPTTVAVINAGTPIVFQPHVPTCTISTPDVLVPLDAQSAGDFGSVGATLGEKDFSISLACSGGDPDTSTSMHMFLADQTTPDNQGNVLSLTSSSTAAGVGVQVLSGDTPVVFGQTSAAPTTDITRNIAVGVPTVDIPLKARYVRTGAMTAGIVQGIATFTIQYL